MNSWRCNWLFILSGPRLHKSMNRSKTRVIDRSLQCSLHFIISEWFAIRQQSNETLFFTSMTGFYALSLRSYWVLQDNACVYIWHMLHRLRNWINKISVQLCFSGHASLTMFLQNLVTQNMPRQSCCLLSGSIVNCVHVT